MTNDEMEKELASLNGELFALRALLFYFLANFTPHGPAIVRKAFDEAADHAEAATIRFGQSASPFHLAKSLEIIEDFRSKIFDQKPGGPSAP